MTFFIVSQLPKDQRLQQRQKLPQSGKLINQPALPSQPNPHPGLKFGLPTPSKSLPDGYRRRKRKGFLQPNASPLADQI